jgi:hypothetical protein
MDRTQERSTAAQGVSLPRLQTYEEVRDHSNSWAAERGIDWSRAVASVAEDGVACEAPIHQPRTERHLGHAMDCVAVSSAMDEQRAM